MFPNQKFEDYRKAFIKVTKLLEAWVSSRVAKKGRGNDKPKFDTRRIEGLVYLVEKTNNDEDMEEANSVEDPDAIEALKNPFRWSQKVNKYMGNILNPTEGTTHVFEGEVQD